MMLRRLGDGRSLPSREETLFQSPGGERKKASKLSPHTDDKENISSNLEPDQRVVSKASCKSIARTLEMGTGACILRSRGHINTTTGMTKALVSLKGQW